MTKKQQFLLEIKNHELNVVNDFINEIYNDDKVRLTYFNYFYYENYNYDFNHNIEYKLYFQSEKYYKKFAVLPYNFDTNNVTKFDGIVFKYKNKDKISQEILKYYNSSENYMDIFIDNIKKYLNNPIPSNSRIFPSCYCSDNLKDINEYVQEFSNESNIIYAHYYKDVLTKLY